MSLSDPEKDFQACTPPGLELLTDPVITFLSHISSPSKIPSNPAWPDETPASPLQSTNNPKTTIPNVTSFLSTGPQFSISIPENNQSENTQELPPFNSLLSDALPLLSRPNHLKFQLDPSIRERLHLREYSTNCAPRTKQPRFNQHQQYSPKPEFSA